MGTRLSKGTYNAGVLRLTNSGKLDIANNHTTWTIFNKVTVDAADSFAIRVAFAKALEAGGVDKKQMNSIRKTLGLAKDDSMRNATALMPLTRQTVRMIIDANIGVLNKDRAGNRRLKTYDELHVGYSKNALEEISTTRDAVNQASSDANGYSVDTELKDVLLVIRANPSFEGISEEEADDFLEVADMLDTALERLVDDDARYDWRRENGGEYKVTMEGGANGMAISLVNNKVVFETVSEGKRSRISLGMTPDELHERLNQSVRILNTISNRDVRMPGEPINAEKFENKNVEADQKTRKRVAQSNLNTLVTAMAKHYEEHFHLDADKIKDILTQVDGWEEQLADCSTEGNGTTMQSLNQDLQKFLTNNVGTIQKLIDEAIAE